MTKKVAPQRGCAIEETPAAIINEIVAFSADDDERVCREVLTHLCKRMPDMLRVPAANIVSGW